MHRTVPGDEEKRNRIHHLSYTVRREGYASQAETIFLFGNDTLNGRMAWTANEHISLVWSTSFFLSNRKFTSQQEGIGTKAAGVLIMSPSCVRCLMPCCTACLSHNNAPAASNTPISFLCYWLMRYGINGLLPFCVSFGSFWVGHRDVEMFVREDILKGVALHARI